jgi:hypothetical protein
MVEQLHDIECSTDFAAGIIPYDRPRSDEKKQAEYGAVFRPYIPVAGLRLDARAVELKLN